MSLWVGRGFAPSLTLTTVVLFATLPRQQFSNVRRFTWLPSLPPSEEPFSAPASFSMGYTSVILLLDNSSPVFPRSRLLGWTWVILRSDRDHPG